ncbi:acyltransferase family protein [Dyella soli]|uniref:Acyltransferase n=1 Tax=Dyella soli TaxID=522319 RepID=A0A4R0YX28_9GAMM|nr:acyltransferase family protein [Dyella soli]TCI10940.1 acyltransferase [Dyella soli]
MRANEYRLGFRGDIEGLRAVAIMLVLAAHAGASWFAGGFVGVDVFFVLSGYLITGLLVREVADTGRIRFADFYLRRLRRLMPALVVMVAISSTVAAVVLAPAEQLEQSSAAAMAVLWLSNIHFALAQLDYFAAGSDSNLFLHTWSLGVEEQFYLLWPALLVWVLGRDLGTPHVARLKLAMVVVATLSFISCLLLTPRFPQLAFYMMPMRAWQFAVGALVWLHCSRGTSAEGNPGAAESVVAIRRWTGWLGLLVILGSGVMFNASMSYPGWRALLPTAGAAAVLWAGLGEHRHGAPGLLAWWPLQAMGRVSYSWYLWHWPVLLLGLAITGSHSPWVRGAEILASLSLAVGSYRLVESPVRHQEYWLKHRRVALIAAVGAMLAASVLSMHWYTSALVRTQTPESQRYASARVDAPPIYAMGCDDWFHSDRVLMCTFGSKDAAHTTVLMGDSIAGQWFPALAGIFDRADWRVIVLTKSSCPMVDEPLFYARIGRDYTECSSWRRQALQQVAAIKPDVVVLGTVSTVAFTQPQWTDGTARVLSSISHAAGRIYILRSTPHLPFDGPNCLASHAGRPKWLGALQVCDAPAFDDHGQQVFEWLQQASARFANVRTIDLTDQICPQGRCRAELNGEVVFRDSQHLTASFARSLGPEMEKRMGLTDFAAPHAVNDAATLH